MNRLRLHGTRAAALLCAVLLVLCLGHVPVWSFSVDAPNLPEITGAPSETPTAEESSASPSETNPTAVGPGAPGAPGASGTESPTGAPAGTETTAPTAAPASAASSNWPLIILMSVCGIGLVLVGLFFWSRREE